MCRHTDAHGDPHPAHRFEELIIHDEEAESSNENGKGDEEAEAEEHTLHRVRFIADKGRDIIYERSIRHQR